MKISVIFTTYNSPVWIEKVLWGFTVQTDSNFEVIVADDGSTEETLNLIKKISAETDMPIRHVWQEDIGFRKCQILNKAILEASGEYIVVTDGDCIPRNDFVSTHRKYAKPGCYLSGGYFKLPMETSRSIAIDDVRSGRVFYSKWLKSNGLKGRGTLKLDAKGVFSRLLNTITPTKRTWNGHNASCYRRDAIRVNGFDERMQYGGQDCEFGERLRNAGLSARQIRYSAICVHLDHARPYSGDETFAKNAAIRAFTRKHKVVETPFGIRTLQGKFELTEKTPSMDSNSPALL